MRGIAIRTTAENTMEQQYDTAIRVWRYENAPETLRLLTAEQGIEWIAWIPSAVRCREIEALFMRWHSDVHPVRRTEMPDGSVVLSGAYPASQEDFSTARVLSDS